MKHHYLDIRLGIMADTKLWGQWILCLTHCLILNMTSFVVWPIHSISYSVSCMGTNWYRDVYTSTYKISRGLDLMPCGVSQLYIKNYYNNIIYHTFHRNKLNLTYLMRIFLIAKPLTLEWNYVATGHITWQRMILKNNSLNVGNFNTHM